MTERNQQQQRRIPKSIWWLVIVILLVILNMWYSSVDLGTMINEFTKSDGTNIIAVNTTVKVEESNTTVLVSTTASSANIPQSTTKSSMKHEQVCKFCNDNKEGRIFNPSIRLTNDGYTCSKAKLDALSLSSSKNNNNTTTGTEKCNFEHLCCPKRSSYSHFWDHNNNPNCFHLEYICHGSNGEWFYDYSVASSRNNQNTTTTRHVKDHQITLVYDSKSQHPTVTPDTRIHFNISSSSSNMYNNDDGLSQCPYSHTPHHVVSQAAYNHMLGEFYVRMVMGLNLWMKEFPPESDHDVQMYLHIPAKDKTIFDGHRLFMGGLPHNGKIDNFLSLVEGNNNNRGGSCECYQTLAFCGYTVNQTANTLELTSQINYKEKRTDKSRWCSGIRGKSNIDVNCTSFSEVRQDMLAQYNKKHPTLQVDVREYKRQTLIKIGLTSDEVEKEGVDEWKIVGLTMRQSRRRWLNIDDAVKACDNFRSQKVVCITVNVEEAASAEEQLLMHMSLNALIGVHGAQLTQGIFLPRHGYIVELLPWIPDWAWGGWVATTDTPTPLGIIYHNTELNHLGYPLDRHSVPLCQHVNKSEERDCFLAQRPKQLFLWDSRNFEVSPDVVTRFVSSFLLPNSTDCNEMERNANVNDFVLYNAYCSHGAVENDEFHTEHYYWAKNRSNYAIDFHRGRES
jgi:hypothetical protein